VHTTEPDLEGTSATSRLYPTLLGQATNSCQLCHDISPLCCYDLCNLVASSIHPVRIIPIRLVFQPGVVRFISVL
jgi:hypothetical protein